MLIEGDKRILIDTGPDLRQQMLRLGIRSLDAVLYTHFHYDHMAGLDDLKPFTFDSKGALQCFANIQTQENILSKHPYIHSIEAYTTVPKLSVEPLPGNEEDGYSLMKFGDLSIQPIRLMHIPKAGVLSTGYVINSKFGYLTDFKEINTGDEKYLYDLEVLYLGSPLDRLHVSHINHGEAIDLITKFRPKRGVIGHLSHQYQHTQLIEKWAGRAEPAFDNLEFKF